MTVAAAHESAASLLAPQQPPLFQVAQGMTHGDSADAEHFAELGLVWKLSAVRPGSVGDQRPQSAVRSGATRAPAGSGRGERRGSAGSSASPRPERMTMRGEARADETGTRAELSRPQCRSRAGAAADGARARAGSAARARRSLRQRLRTRSPTGCRAALRRRRSRRQERRKASPARSSAAPSPARAAAISAAPVRQSGAPGDCVKRRSRGVALEPSTGFVAGVGRVGAGPTEGSRRAAGPVYDPSIREHRRTDAGADRQKNDVRRVSRRAERRFGEKGEAGRRCRASRLGRGRPGPGPARPDRAGSAPRGMRSRTPSREPRCRRATRLCASIRPGDERSERLARSSGAGQCPSVTASPSRPTCARAARKLVPPRSRQSAAVIP